MVSRLRRDELAAEKATVQSLLAQARDVGDALGVRQFEARLERLDGEIDLLRHFPQHKASIALFFGGPKVVGSKGIDSDFAGNALDTFQDMVSKTFARREVGELGARGPVPIRHDSRLMVTGVTRGSFGFVLEEIGDQQEVLQTQLSAVVDDVVTLLDRVTDPDDNVFLDAAAEMDARLVASVRAFFGKLAGARASLRLVEGEKDVTLDQERVELGRERTEALEVTEQDAVELSGLLFGLLPAHRRFEFVLQDSGENISGKVASDSSREIGDQIIGGLFNPVGKSWRAEFDIRDVTRPGRPTRRYYTLLRLLEEIQDQEPTQ